MIKKINKDLECSYMHTVKSRESIRDAYFKYNVKSFSLDTKEELIKIIESTEQACSVDSIILINSSFVSSEKLLTLYLKYASLILSLLFTVCI